MTVVSTVISATLSQLMQRVAQKGRYICRLKPLSKSPRMAAVSRALANAVEESRTSRSPRIGVLVGPDVTSGGSGLTGLVSWFINSLHLLESRAGKPQNHPVPSSS